MFSRICLGGSSRILCQARSVAQSKGQRAFHQDGRNRLSNFWVPTQKKDRLDGTKTNDDEIHGNGHRYLLRAGYLRQAHSGIFHLLPLGLRVQDKIERLIDKHMIRLGASKLSMSTISSEDLWKRSGRLDAGRGSELFRFEDRKESKYLLSPTHEEEITMIVANTIHSYKDLPLRLYQISRKYRDEARPRQGLLRGREFLMKDLYTFDLTEEKARETYETVKGAYSSILDELKLPYFVVGADSGNMGGKLSHEYQFSSSNGEDTIIKCENCGYAVNEEIYMPAVREFRGFSYYDCTQTDKHVASSQDRKTLLEVHYPKGHEINLHALKKIFPNIDNSGIPEARLWAEWENGDGDECSCRKHLILYDPRIVHLKEISSSLSTKSHLSIRTDIIEPEFNGQQIILTKAKQGDHCPSCSTGRLQLHKAIEIGHTFHLGTRYSDPLNLKVKDANNQDVKVSMGCHGIGISRMIGAIAGLLSDGTGLNWPLAISPFQVLVIAASNTSAEDVSMVYDNVTAAGLDVAIDDRNLSMGWKLNDADLVGYPFVLVMGKGWQQNAKPERVAEVQCRQLRVKEKVSEKELVSTLLNMGKLL
ncbi:hypothetical protein M433DRAFT_152581 [Acidomyces richmondensis BFW]|nr:hypothetical protein M433DRAFT_152581 [Acidomyces richmondensis BFW]